MKPEYGYKKIRWGILGAGIIAHKMAEAIVLDPDSELIGIASRTPGKAEAFAEKYTIQKYSYESLLESTDVDVVYVATTHNLHCDNAKLALTRGKHVVVEKPFTVNALEAQELVKLAREQGCFLMEAIWTRFLPSMQRLKELISANAIGSPRHFNVNFGCMAAPEYRLRLDSPELAGGVTLDMGIYPISFLCFLLGEFPVKVRATAQLTELGVDGLANYNFVFGSGCTASVTTSFNLVMESNAILYGDKGYIRLDEFQAASRYTLVKHEGVNGAMNQQHIKEDNHENGFVYQVAAAVNCLRAGKLESDIIPLDDSIRIMQILDEIRDQIGVTYPFE